MTLLMLLFCFYSIATLEAGNSIFIDIINKKIETYNGIEVCNKYHAKDVALLEVKETIVDCMSKEFDINLFCKKMVKTNNFVRGYGIKKSKKIICISGSDVNLKINCRMRNKFCKDIKKECRLLNKLYAYDLSLIRSFSNNNFLNCTFSKK